MATTILKITELADCVVTSLRQPVMAGGPAVCEFTSYNDYANGVDITVKSGTTVRFAGQIVKRGRTRTKSEISKRAYTAYCKAYVLATAEDVTIAGYGTQEEAFSGNGAEYQDWLIRENPLKHVIWPMTGVSPVVFIETDAASSLPANIEQIGYVEENSLPSHIKCVVRKYREKRFPVLADFDSSFIPTADQLKTQAKFAAYGKQFSVMTPGLPTAKYVEKPLAAASVGGSKFFIKGHVDARWMQKDNFSLSASCTGKKIAAVLKKIGTPLTPGVAAEEKRNIIYVDMVYDKDMSLPRVLGAHGILTAEQECFVRLRVLEELSAKSVALGGVNSQDRLPSVNHVEIEVQYDTYDGTHYRDWTFAGAPGLLNTDTDVGGGVWTADLTGTYIAEEGEDRAIDMVNAALAHYENMRYTTDIMARGHNWTLFKKISVDGNNVLIDSIDYEIKPGDQRTKMTGARTMKGFSQQLAKKKRWIEQQETVREKERQAAVHVEAKEPAVAIAAAPKHAIIAWRLTATGGGGWDDLSEGELMDKPVDTWARKGEFIWIDFQTSRVSFDTAGDDTIFEVKLMESAFARGTVIRDLYHATAVIQEGTRKITHLETISKASKIGFLLSFDLLTKPPWADIYDHGNASDAYLFTSLNDVSKQNIIEFDTPNNWNLAGSGDFLYLERTGAANQRKTFVPVSPRLISENGWESAERDPATGAAIATYTSKLI